MAESRFLYVTYIRATQQTIWDHLTDPAANKQFWGGYHQRTGWNVGDDYEIVAGDGNVWDRGKVLEADPPRRLRVSWNHLSRAELTAEGESQCTIELEPGPTGGVTKLTLTHVIGVAPPSKFIEAVSTGWPSILASLKSLIETGRAL